MGIITDRDWEINELNIGGYEAVLKKYDLNKITDIATIASYLCDCGCIPTATRNTWNNKNYQDYSTFITRNVYKSLIEEKASSLYAKFIISPFGNDNRLLSLKHIAPAGKATGTISFIDSNYNSLNSYVTGIVIHCKNGVNFSSVYDPSAGDMSTYSKSSLSLTTGTQKIPIGKYEIDYVDLSHNGPQEKYTPSTSMYVEVTASTSDTLAITYIRINNSDHIYTS